MSAYERQCQWALRAFPPEFRADRQAEILTTLVEAAPDPARRLSVGDATDLVTTGLRMRAARAGAGPGIKGGVGATVELAALLGLWLQAAIALATLGFFIEHQVVFYLIPTFPLVRPLGSGHLGVWIGLAVCSLLGFVAHLRGRPILAAGYSLASTSYLVAVSIVLFATAGRGPDQYQGLIATPAFVGVALIATSCSCAAALRSRSRSTPKRPWPLLVAVLGLGLLFTLVGDAGTTGTFANLSWAAPPQGGIMTALQYLWGGAVLISIPWSRLDPRAGWATALLSVPFVGYQVSSFTFGQSYYGELYEPGWKPALPLIVACVAILVLLAVGVTGQRRLRTL
jgi:hypothetical protein